VFNECECVVDCCRLLVHGLVHLGEPLHQQLQGVGLNQRVNKAASYSLVVLLLIFGGGGGKYAWVCVFPSGVRVVKQSHVCVLGGGAGRQAGRGEEVRGGESAGERNGVRVDMRVWREGGRGGVMVWKDTA